MTEASPIADSTLPRVLRADKVSLKYGATEALVNASASVAAGEVLAITGPSGSGKSSLLLCLAGIVQPNAGTITFLGDDITQLGEAGLSRLRRTSFGFVFQFAELVPELTLRDNIELPLEINRIKRGERRRRVGDILERLQITSHADRRPGEVSGGQAQRAAVARALVHNPAVVFADEPTGSLDSEMSALVIDAFFSLARERGAAVVVATHDPVVAQRADRQLGMVDGAVTAAPKFRSA